MLWSRPENKRHAGKLLVVGGHKQSFSEPSRAYSAALKAGAGHVRIVLPDSLQKTVGRAFPEAEFAASTPIGSFGRQALGSLLDLAEWADGVLLAGDISKNSETAVLLESFIDKYAGQLTLAGDSLDYFFNSPQILTNRSATTLVGSLSQIQKLAHSAAIRQQDDLVQILNKLSIWTADMKASVLTEQGSQIIVAHRGKISTTASEEHGSETELAAYASVWRLQQLKKPFEGLTTAVYSYTDE